ncbi:hypothetical protein FOA43_001162 [Brettanomyces nanus]|uniref:Uncharacterized protein n=1 Tax=Eeniella nana TaxID=13502 RepID=A0A875RTU0_EENNA|nr:uncharacterized protein FOA43_001162 [Brettanomyces nanus]QPG73847.1 hypothetical protein FOA43_001162 [Brettanomyces nanus]
MAVPFSTDVLINVFRESSISIGQRYESQDKRDSNKRQQQEPGGVLRNSSSNTNSSSPAGITSKQIGYIMGYVYKPETVANEVNVSQDFPLLTQYEGQPAPPIRWDVLNEATYGSSLKEEEEEEEEGEEEQKNLSVAVPLKSSVSRGQEVVSESAGTDKHVKTISEPSSVAATRHSLQKSKSRGLFERLISRKKPTSEDNLDGTGSRSKHMSTDEDTDSTDSSLMDSSMIDDSQEISQGQDNSGSSGLDLSGSVGSVGSIESSEIADDDDDDYMMDSPLQSTSQYMTGDVSGYSYSDDYYLDSDDYLSDSDYPADEGSIGTSSAYRESHPVSRINFTSSRQGAYSSSKPAYSVSMRSRTTSLSSSQQSRFQHPQPQAPLPLGMATYSAAGSMAVPGPTSGVASSRSYQRLEMKLKRSSKSLGDMLLMSGDQEPHQALDFTKREVKRRGSQIEENKLNVSDTESISSLPSISSLQSRASSETRLSSKLTALINKKTLSLDYYDYVGRKKTPSDVLEDITVYIPGLKITAKSPLVVKVNTSVRVVEMIGFILLTLKGKEIPLFEKFPAQPNFWVLYLADDDGKAEDDFGVLDRTRMVKSYGADEFVMTEVSEEEMQRNEKITPSPLEVAERRQKQLPLPVQKSRELFMDSPAQHVRNTSLATISSNLTPGSVPGKQLKSSRRSIDDDSSLITNESEGKDEIISPSVANKGMINMDYPYSANAGMSIYHRWTVWRRQQMSFKSKNARTLTVDGYQIYILPFNESKGSWYESKTSSFNIGQVVRIKQSSKVPRYLKIFVNRHNDGAMKKYYLEAKNGEQCREIVTTIKKLAERKHE